MEKYHITVMLREAVDLLQIKEDGVYVDCTLGGGGHSLEIVKKLSEKGTLISFDYDQDALDHVEKLRSQENYKCKWLLVKSNFSKLSKVISEKGFEKVDGVLFDFGVSSHQLDELERGFSFRFDSDLDMRMDQSLGVKAVDLVNGLYKKEIERLLRVYGEEPFAKRISIAIDEARKEKKIETTYELLNVIQKVVPFKARKKSAMRVFQAFRIAVNDEINNINSGLPQALEILASGGRCVAISFHSLEDRIVKDLFREAEKNNLGNCVNKKPILPTEEELKNNSRARSSKLRAFEKY